MSAMDSFQAYRDSAREEGVPEHAIELALSLARPCVELSSTGEGGGILVGQYGGLPSLPADVEWSGYPDLIASVDCAALPRDALDIPLPRDGHLLFFANRSDCTGPEDGHVVYVPAGTVTAERTPDEEGAPCTDPHPLYARPTWSLPMDCDGAVMADEETNRVYTEYELDDYDNGKKVWQVDLLLGGYAQSPQDPPFIQTSPDEEEGEWMLLAHGQYKFADFPELTGCPFWIIYRHDLEAMNFAGAEFMRWSYQ